MQPRGFDCKRIWFGPKSGFYKQQNEEYHHQHIPTHSDVRKILWLLGSPFFFESLESYHMDPNIALRHGHGSHDMAQACEECEHGRRFAETTCRMAIWVSWTGWYGSGECQVTCERGKLMFKWAPFYERVWTIGICKANSYWSLYTVETSRNQLGDLADWGITLSLDVDDGYCIGSLINHDQSTMASNQKLSDNPNVKTMKLSRWSRFTIITIIIISYYGPLGLHQNRPWEPLGESQLHHVGRRVWEPLVLFSDVSWTKLVQISPL